MNVLILGPEGRNERVKEFLEERGARVSFHQEPLSLDFLDELSPDWIVSNGYGPIIKGEVIQKFPNRIINIHPAYVPEGRGIFPNFWSFIEGFPKGSSLHFINEGIDTGDLIAREEISYTDVDTLATTNDKLLDLAEDLFFRYWDKIVDQTMTPKVQEKTTHRSFYHRRLDGEMFLEYLPERWNTSVREVEEFGSDMLMSLDFWTAYDEEATAIKPSVQD